VLGSETALLAHIDSLFLRCKPVACEILRIAWREKNGFKALSLRLLGYLGFMRNVSVRSWLLTLVLGQLHIRRSCYRAILLRSAFNSLNCRVDNFHLAGPSLRLLKQTYLLVELLFSVHEILSRLLESDVIFLEGCQFGVALEGIRF
jgi:hypothetical protein